MLAVAYSSTGNYKGINNGNTDFDSAALAVGKGCVGIVPYGNGGTPTFASAAAWSLSVDGDAQEMLLLGSQYAILAWPNITSSAQVLSVTNGGAYVEGAAYFLEVTGHDVAQMLGNSVAEIAGDGFLPPLTIGAGNGVVASHSGSDTTSLYQGVGGSWNSPSQAMNSHANVGTSWNVTPNAGSQVIELLSGVAYVQIAFELRAAAGAGGNAARAMNHYRRFR